MASLEAQQTAQGIQRTIAEMLAQFLENWRRAYRERLQSLEADKDNAAQSKVPFKEKDVAVVVEGQLIYGKDKNNFVDQLTESEVERLRQMLKTPVGQKVESAPERNVELHGKVVLESDSSGKITKNLALQQTQTPRSSVQSLTPPSTEQKNSAPSIPLEKPQINPYFQGPPPPTQVAVGYPAKSALGQAQKALAPLGEKNPMSALIKNMFQEIKELKTQNSQMQQQLKQLVENKDVKSTAQTSNWIEQLKERAAAFRNNYQQKQTAVSYALALKQLFHQQAAPNATAYHSEKYTIARRANNYTLQDDAGNNLLRFSTAAFGSIVIQDLNLSQKNHSDLQELLAEQKQTPQPSPAFAPVGISESNRFERTEKIVQTLVQYAQTQGKQTELKGENYLWMAHPNGDVRIDNSKGQTVFLKSNGTMINRMSDRDLAYFERAFASIQKQQLASTQAQSQQIQKFAEANNGRNLQTLSQKQHSQLER